MATRTIRPRSLLLLRLSDEDPFGAVSSVVRTFHVTINAYDIMQNQRLIQWGGRVTWALFSFFSAVVLWLLGPIQVEMEATCKAERHS